MATIVHNLHRFWIIVTVSLSVLYFNVKAKDWHADRDTNERFQHLPTKVKFRAAVYSHAVQSPVRNGTVVSRSQAGQDMIVNLNIYREQVIEAGKQGADIIVFPEDGIIGFGVNRETIYPYLEDIPDPIAERWSPCDNPDRYDDVDVQVALSCMAKHNQLYLVANMADVKTCDPKLDAKCPKDGRCQYNTDVAYGPDGTFLARYHKYNLYFEFQFDKPPVEIAFFDTHFGRVGMMTCFDILFKYPGIPLVHHYNITTLAFPTAWGDELPLLSAIGFHSSYARGNNVNVLASNVHFPEFGSHGSGVYSPDGAHGFYYGVVGSKPKLVVAELDSKPEISRRRFRRPRFSAQRARFEKEEQSISRSRRFRKTSTNDYQLHNSAEFQSVMAHDVYTFRALKGESGRAKVCQGRICCLLDYTYTQNSKQTEMFALGVLDGLHTHHGNYYMQNCALVKCANSLNKTSCGSAVVTTNTQFSNIRLSGTFLTPYVYPQVVLANESKALGISAPGAWNFDGVALETTSSFKHGIVGAFLIGRDYDADNKI